ncbi:MAG: thioredoxin family protein [Dysgonamonadaceae bacterium]|jgi:thiol:disulfide interchange protein DsbD|nr:thioredoxin family protein [Dysgonamonadaceae bacterium]
MTKYIYFITSIFLYCCNINAQIREPVQWRRHINEAGEMVFRATVEKGWHLYDMNLPEGGPISTSFEFEKVSGADLSGKVYTNSKVISQYEEMFGMTVRWFAENPTFVQKLKITDRAKFQITGSIDYMVCNNENCIPGAEEFQFSSGDLPSDLSETAPSVPAVQKDFEDFEDLHDPLLTDYWNPIVAELQNLGQTASTADKSWLLIFILGFGGGLLALLTPCVWPIIPMTVSFFLKRSKSNRKKAVFDAATYGLSIIVIYLLLGLLITAIFGASALNDLSTNAVFNLLFFALLVLFAVSFFGAFELTLPASWSNKMDGKTESTSGLISIFFMAFTLSLVSFSCTGPIIGTLLVEAAGSGGRIGPAVGMFGFSLALALPFTLFALFPSWLQNLPKSGGWLNSVKVVLGFLELALALKFLSVADLAYGWRILDREVFLVLWIVIFALLGLYLLGKIKLPHDSDLKHLSVPRLFLAIISLSFAVYMLPGLWGAPLKAVSAFSPPLYTQDFNLYDGEVRAKFFDYEEGMEYARKNRKPVMIDFTGYGCVNCREMEAAVWSDPRVKRIIDNDYVLISLYVDDKTRLDQVAEMTENGKTRKLRTVGDKWSYLQRHKFGSNAQPFYVLLNNDGMPLVPAHSYDKNIENYISFLRKGVERYDVSKQQLF